jgi:hypothetical protein
MIAEAEDGDACRWIERRGGHSNDDLEVAAESMRSNAVTVELDLWAMACYDDDEDFKDATASIFILPTPAGHDAGSASELNDYRAQVWR